MHPEVVLHPRERRQGPLVSPVAQQLLDNPYQTISMLYGLHTRARGEAPYIHSRQAQNIKILIDPLVAVVGHQIAMSMVLDRESKPLATSPNRETNIPILSSISLRVMDSRKESVFGTENESLFIPAQMQRFNPYFETVLEQAMQIGNPYAPVWQAYVDLNGQFLNALAAGSKSKKYFSEEQESDNPISSLHRTFWEGIGSLSPFVTALDRFIYSDKIKTVGEFQQQAIDCGALGILAKAPEIPKVPRDIIITEGEGVIPFRYFYQEPQTGRVTYRDDKKDESGQPLHANLARLISEGLTLCVGPYGLLDPSEQIRKTCKMYNNRVGSKNRSSAHFLPTNAEDVATMAEVFAFNALLDAPSTLWLPFLESKGITDWSDVLPGTRLPDGTIKQNEKVTGKRGAVLYKSFNK